MTLCGVLGRGWSRTSPGQKPGPVSPTPTLQGGRRSWTLSPPLVVPTRGEAPIKMPEVTAGIGRGVSVATARERRRHPRGSGGFSLGVPQQQSLKTGGEPRWHAEFLVLVSRILCVCPCQHTLSGEVKPFRPEEEAPLPHRCVRLIVKC